MITPIPRSIQMTENVAQVDAVLYLAELWILIHFPAKVREVLLRVV